ncbi:MAG: polynucleotide adenylyltransferase PcnB [Nevskiaceae bacterium]
MRRPRIIRSVLSLSKDAPSLGALLQARNPIIEAQRIPRSEHPISRSHFTNATLKTLYSLRDAGYEAYVVGGGVRDILAGLKHKDFDIATNARPEEIKKLFRSCRLVGRRFLIAHVHFGGEIIEVTTFRGAISESHERDETGRILSDNLYGTLESDAFRRDFTVNALYYDIRDFAIVDHVGGMNDLQAKTLRLIGDPELRYREDPVRMLRAVRIANKLHFRLDPAAAAPIERLAPLLGEIPPARLFDEVLKLLLNPDAVENFRALHWFHLWRELFPEVDARLEEEPERSRAFIEGVLSDTEKRIAQDLQISPSFLFAVLLWPVVSARAAELTRAQGHPESVALAQAADEVLARQQTHVAIPKRFSMPAREIWLMQPRFDQRRGGRPKRMMAHPRFRAAYDFLQLRAGAGEAVQEQASWWRQAEGGSLPAIEVAPSLAEAVSGEGPTPRPRRRRRRGGRGRQGQAPSPPSER